MPTDLEIERVAADGGGTEYVISYSVSRRSHVRIEITEGTGRTVRALVDELKEPGSYRVKCGLNNGERNPFEDESSYCRMIARLPNGQAIMKSRAL